MSMGEREHRGHEFRVTFSVGRSLAVSESRHAYAEP
jgi:hypothetical protein